MRLSSVNIGGRRTQPKGAELEVTGIYKRPTDGPATITTLGLLNDFIGDARYHGGPDQAVYIYGSADYDWWAGEMGQSVQPGTFGDNLTIDGLETARLNIGDRLHFGETILEVTAARIPCSTLSRRMGDLGFAAAFRAAERPGSYCRVIAPGSVATGDAVWLEPYAGDAISLLEMFRGHYRRNKSEEDLRRLLRLPISTRARNSLQAELDHLLRAPAA